MRRENGRHVAHMGQPKQQAIRNSENVIRSILIYQKPMNIFRCHILKFECFNFTDFLDQMRM